MIELILDDNTTDEELESLVGLVLADNPVESFGSFETPKQVLSAYRMRNGWIRIEFTGNTYTVFSKGKVAWNA